jgi:hypothetical protein
MGVVSIKEVVGYDRGGLSKLRVGFRMTTSFKISPKIPHGAVLHVSRHIVPKLTSVVCWPEV